LSQTRPQASFLYIAALICLLAVGLFMFSKSDYFAVQEIRTEGLNNVAEDEVFRLLGTVKGENLFLTDTEVLARKIKLHPLVDEAVVKKELPATLVLKIKERLPVALILNDDGMAEVDSQGIILRFFDTWPQEDNPVLTGIEVPDTLGPGQKIDNSQLDKALLLRRQAPEDLVPLMGEIHISADGQVFLYLTTGIEVRIGHDNEYSNKLKLLKELLDSTEYKVVEKAIKYIDLTAGKPVLGQ
jgi:cell division protein FtsQ